MIRIMTAAALAGVLSVTAERTPAHDAAAFVDLSVIDDTGRVFTSYPAVSNAPDLLRSYVQAEHGARFRLRLHNPHAERIGVVVAVDGRNIISGQRSHLAQGEAMYVIGPHRTQIFSGWRTDANHVHAFYFTGAGDSYAGALGDYSALGTIGVAVFRERHNALQPVPEIATPPLDAPTVQPDDATGDSTQRRSREAQESDAGTGFGERQWSQSRRVTFAAAGPAVFRHILKYEWREALCRRGVIDCPQHNRLWPDIGYAPYPPGHPRPRW